MNSSVQARSRVHLAIRRHVDRQDAGRCADRLELPLDRGELRPLLKRADHLLVPAISAAQHLATIERYFAVAYQLDEPGVLTDQAGEAIDVVSALKLALDEFAALRPDRDLAATAGPRPSHLGRIWLVCGRKYVLAYLTAFQLADRFGRLSIRGAHGWPPVSANLSAQDVCGARSVLSGSASEIRGLIDPPDISDTPETVRKQGFGRFRTFRTVRRTPDWSICLSKHASEITVTKIRTPTGRPVARFGRFGRFLMKCIIRGNLDSIGSHQSMA
jgi:hypothetical protein